MVKLSDQPVAIVTGGGSGMGLATASELASDHHVVVVGRRKDVLEDAVSAIGEQASAFPADLTDVDQVQAVADHVVETFGRVDVLVNMAGVRPPMLYTDADLREAVAVWHEQMALNATSQFMMAFAVARHLTRPGGRIVNVSSEAAVSGGSLPGMSTYAAAKGAVHGLTLSLARELSPVGITVNCVVPGYVEATGLTADFGEAQREALAERIPVRRAGRVSDMASAVRYLVSEGAGFVTGQFLHLNGGSTFGR
ncbi:SDR family oxidoreductase [Sporichthya brevicatena]|uniref:SDR family oxidoreductase n=1 Tax=Sporichthya brevicatena TaxID=171442 RepID=A0ABN1GI40_9ACTN